MDRFTRAARKLVGRLKEELGERPESILSMAVDGTSCTVLALGADHAPLRDALLWMDVRAFKQADRIARSGAEALKYNGFGSVSAEWMPSKVLWLKEEEPDIFAGASVFCELQDWVNLRLTGELVASVNNVTARWYYNTRAGETWTAGTCTTSRRLYGVIQVPGSPLRRARVVVPAAR